MKLPNEITLHYTINCVFGELRPHLFEKMLIEWLAGLKNDSINKEVISIDAMGEQVEIAKKIIKNEADYIFSLKSNQSELLDQVKERFEKQNPDSANLTNEKAHGHIKSRKCEVITDLTFIDNSIS